MSEAASNKSAGASRGDQWRFLRDESGVGARDSVVTNEAAAALACGFSLYGQPGPTGSLKAFLDETWIEAGEKRRRVSFTFRHGERIPIAPIAEPETVTLAEVWRRLRSLDWLKANPGHPVTWVFCAHLQRFHLERKLIAGEIRPRPSLIGDLPPLDTFPDDPLPAALRRRELSECIDPDLRLTFRPIPAAEEIDLPKFGARWESGEWLDANPDHPIAWTVRSFSEVGSFHRFLLPVICPEPGEPVGVPMETHVAIFGKRGRTKKKTWIPKTLTREQREEVIAILRNPKKNKNK